MVKVNGECERAEREQIVIASSLYFLDSSPFIVLRREAFESHFLCLQSSLVFGNASEHTKIGRAISLSLSSMRETETQVAPRKQQAKLKYYDLESRELGKRHAKLRPPLEEQEPERFLFDERSDFEILTLGFLQVEKN